MLSGRDLVRGYQPETLELQTRFEAVDLLLESDTELRVKFERANVQTVKGSTVPRFRVNPKVDLGSCGSGIMQFRKKNESHDWCWICCWSCYLSCCWSCCCICCCPCFYYCFCGSASTGSSRSTTSSSSSLGSSSSSRSSTNHVTHVFF